MNNENTNTNVLNVGIGDPTKNLTIQDIKVENVTFEDNRSSNKAVLVCETGDGRVIDVSEAWTKDKKGISKVQGLWVNLDNNEKLAANSVLAKFLTYNKVGTLNELVGKTLTGYPDEKDYTVFTSFDDPISSTTQGSVFDN